MIFNLNEQKVLSDPSGSSVFKGEKDFNDIVVNLPDNIDGHTATELNYVMHFVDSDGGYSTKILTVDSSGEALKATATVSTNITSKAQAFYAYVLMTDEEETVIGKTNGVIVMIHPVPDEENEIIPPADADKIIKGLEEIVQEATETIETATEAISSKQDKLTAGENITISDDNVISAEGGGVTDYDDLTDKPRINGYVLSGNKSSDDLRLMPINTITGVPRNDIHVNYPYDFNKNVYLERDIYINEDSYNNRYRVGVQDNFFRDYSGTMGVIKQGEYYFDTLKRYYAFCGCFLFQRSDLRNVPSFIEDISGNIQIIQLFTPSSQAGYGSSLIRCVIGKDSTSQQLKIYFQNAYVTLQQDGSYTVSNQSDWQEIGGGSQIVSAVVNANGTITFTDSEGNTFTTTGSSVIGADGFSPVATVTQAASGATVSITDSTGTTTANISNGQDYVLTNQDKTDIANIVLSELPTTQGVLYGNQSN